MTPAHGTNATLSDTAPLLEQQIAALLDLTRAVTEADDLHAVLTSALQPMATATGWCYGQAWLPHEPLGMLHSAAIWHEDDSALAEFARSSNELRFTPGVGLLGHVWQSQQIEWVADVAALDPVIALQPERVLAAGMRSGLFMPIVVHHHVLALLVFFAREVRPINQPLIRLIALVAAQIGTAIQRLQTEESLRVHEALRAAKNELERVVRLKDEFLANMSHELRTPLNAVLTLTEAVTEGVYGTINPRQRYALDAVAESGQHLLALINDILDLTKIESGTVDLVLEPVDVEEICAASLRMVRQLAYTKQLQISSSLDPCAAVVAADPRRLKQILVNLLSNAVKFTPEGGRVCLDVVGDQAAEVVRFTISDTGIGIASADIDRLFKPFVQLDSRLSRRHEGTGLGLAIVARLTDLHGGSVSVSSAPGLGSRFTVALPWRGPEHAPGRPTA